VALLGDNILPDVIQERRESLRMRLQELRSPIREKRQQVVPGPDVIGEVEMKAIRSRNRLVNRDMSLSELTDSIPGVGDSDDGTGGNGGKKSKGKNGDSGNSGKGNSSDQSNNKQRL
jgi:hypothetical protein